MIDKKFLYYGASGSSTEIGLREEFDNTQDGAFPEIAKFQTGLLRKFRRDSSDELVPCPCIDSVTGEPDRESRCPVCLGEGNLWDEKLMKFFYQMEPGGATQQDHLITPGISNVETSFIYVSSTVNLTKDDKIVLLKLDKDGVPLQPLQRYELYRIADLEPKRLDNGRLEFWKAYCYQDNNKFL